MCDGCFELGELDDECKKVESKDKNTGWSECPLKSAIQLKEGVDIYDASETKKRLERLRKLNRKAGGGKVKKEKKGSGKKSTKKVKKEQKKKEEKKDDSLSEWW